MLNDETYLKIAQDFARIREDWIKHSIRCNVDESELPILDFQQFIEDNDVKLVFNPRTDISELRMNNEIIGKFSEKPEIKEEEGTFRFITEYWTKNAGER